MGRRALSIAPGEEPAAGTLPVGVAEEPVTATRPMPVPTESSSTLPTGGAGLAGDAADRTTPVHTDDPAIESDAVPAPIPAEAPDPAVDDAHLSVVNRLLARLPAMRTGDVRAARAELVELRRWLLGRSRGLDTAAPAGLRRLPVHRGLARRWASVDRWPDLAVGMRCRAPDVLLAVAAPTALGSPCRASGTIVEVVVWSRSARLVGLLDIAAPGGLVAFGAGCQLRVLRIDRRRQTPRVLLTETAPSDRSGDAAADEHRLRRMDAALAAAADPTTDPAPAWLTGHGELLASRP